MKTVQIDKVKIRVFEEEDLRNKLNLDEKGIKLVLDYQRTFPELLQDDAEGFVINGETLWNELNKPQGRYSKWYNRKIKDFYIEGVDFSRCTKIVPSMKNGNGKKVERHYFTLETAKHIAMSTGTDFNSSEEVRNKGRLVRDYFILMERTLRNYKEWADVRGEEKSGYNNMVMELTKWIERNGHDIKDLKVFRARECNMLNIALTGMSATEIRSYFESKDEITRDNLTTEYNKALSKLQELNTSLLISDLDYTMRSGIIEGTCKRQYPHLYIKEQMEKIS